MTPPTETTGLEIAVIGLAGRFPEAADLDAFWRNLSAGHESITTFTEAELRAAGVDAALLNDPGYVKAGAVLEDADRFDAAFFGYNPREASVLDPQHRLLLECAWEALENAGYNPEAYPGAVGVFAGASLNSYLLFNLVHNPEVREIVDGYVLTLANDKDFLTTRLSYKLNLRGPSVNVQTACSTSLVAVHLACQSLLSFQCDLALAGGVSVRFPQKQGYRYIEGGILSPDGHCRAFDEMAGGTVGGEGLGLVVLKRLAEALDDGDTIRAVIKGTAINNDGANKVGYTAPSVNGQAEVIAQALAVAGVDAATIQHIETHGTGTALGDPIEVAALHQVFGPAVAARNTISLSSVKTNIGHLDAAAGIASLIKTVLALEHKALPASLYFTRPNPRLNLEKTPFFVNAALRAWPAPAHGGPRRAGVSSFGIGGTNAHAVLEEAPACEPSGPAREWQLLTLSARTPEALEAATARLAAYFNTHPDANLADVAYTLHVGRKAFPERCIVVARNSAEALITIGASPADTAPTMAHSVAFTGSILSPSPSLAFLFTGQGAQYPKMALGLYESEPVFREHLEHCATLLRPDLATPLLDLLFGENPDLQSPTSAPPPLDQTAHTQPALFAIEYALAQLWLSWGVRPSAMLGHSLGEYVAACLAGVFTLEDALALVAARGRLMQGLPPGLMLSVPLPESEARRYADGRVDLAAVNAPALCVLSGAAESIAEVEARLRAEGVEVRRLHTLHAFHSAMMEPILESFADRVADVELRPPQIPFISNVTGTWITDDQATDPRYWARHLRQAVRFADGVAELLQEPGRICLEVGPGRTLTTLVKSQPAAAGHIVLSSLRHPNDLQPDPAFLLTTLGRLWLAGVSVDWAAFHANERRRRLPLPTYPFERERYWVEPPTAVSAPRAGESRKRPDVREWFYAPSWKRGDLPPLFRGQEGGRAALAGKRRWLLITHDDSLLTTLTAQLEASGQDVIGVSPGPHFDQLAERQYVLAPERGGDFDALLDELHLLGRLPDHLLLDVREGFGGARDLRCLYSLLHLVQALGRHVTGRIQLVIVTAGAQAVTGAESLAPFQAALLGLSRVIPQEYPNLTVRAVDVDAGSERNLPARLLAEFFAPLAERVSAYRGAFRWTQVFEPIDLSDMPQPEGLGLRPGGVYLITGGLGRIGLKLAEHLARAVQAKLVLVGRSAHLEAERRQRLESLGAEVLVLAADVSDEAQLRAALAQAEARFGALHGVIHAAGLVGPSTLKPIAEIGPVEVEAQFKAKLYGAAALARVLEAKPLDFVILQSSLSTILGGLGLGAYAAANAGLDALAYQQAAQTQTRWMSLDWDGWDFGEATGTPVGRNVAELMLTPDEGVRAFEYALTLDNARQVVIATADLNARLDRWFTRAEAEAPATRPASVSGQARPRLGVAYVAPRDEIEQAVAGLWGEVLGIERIGVNDDFFELGGHSLLATQIASRLRSRFQVELPLRQLFEAPTVAGVAALIAAARSATAQAAASPSAPALLAVPRTDGGEYTAGEPLRGSSTALPRDDLPLSFGQQRLWFLDQLDPGSPLYNNPAAVRISGLLEVDALTRALNEIIRRHEILRTTYVAEGGQPRQRIAPSLVFTPAFVDLSTLAATEQEAEIAQSAANDAQQPFDLARGPLLRVTLLKLAEAEHVLLLTMHHIVSDGWSLGTFTRELTTLYAAFVRGEPSPLPPLPIQYADFAAWQRRTLTADRLDAQLAYWKARLGQGSPPLELPTNRPRPSVQSFRGATRWVRLPESLSAALNELGRRHNATLFMTLAAGLLALLQRYTGQTDLSLATPIAGRNHVETEGLIGFFVNTLILRVDVDGDPTFFELLGRVREAALGAYAHQDLPFEMLVDAIKPERDLSRTPLAQVMFVLQNAPASAPEVAGLRLTPLETDTGTAKFDLTLMLEESSEGLRGWWNYNTDLFDAATIERMVAHFENLLRGAVADPARRLSTLPLLTAAERAQLAAWNDTAPAAPSVPVHLLIEAQAARTPDQVAVVAAAGATLSYRELDERATQLARRLRERGVGPECIVGVCVERSPEAIIALLGILKAGGAYLPLDPPRGDERDYPAERLAFMLRDSAASLVLTQRSLVAGLQSASPDTPLLTLDGGPPLADQQQTENGGQPSQRSDAVGDQSSALAYVIYTSGSTGQPKGVLIEHGALAAHCRDIVAHFALTPADRVLQFAALTFDPSLEQVLPTLMTGATVVLRDNDLWPPQDFYRRVVELGLTVVNVPPAYWQQIAQACADQPAHPDARLRLVIVGGDAMRTEALAAWRRTPLAGARLLNAYGPTEATITATAFEIAPDDTPSGNTLPIGRPLPSRQAWVLDAHGYLAPVGVPGELCLAGNLARGYLNRPELTAERFLMADLGLQIANLEAQSEIRNLKSKIYKTGDLVRYLPDGNLEFLGRVDQQVKVRGFRVELGEIEAVLLQHPAVRQAVVVAREAEGGDKRLAAYLVTDADEPSFVGDLRSFLKARLPAYMVPSDFVALGALPLTAGGKVDRRALPALSQDGTALTRADYVAPRDPVEAQLAQLWAEVLRRERVGIYDDFFELGGHSLLATLLVARIRAAFQVELPLRRLFEATTVADLAVLIAQERAAQAEAAEVEALLAELESLSDEDAQRLLAADHQDTHP